MYIYIYTFIYGFNCLGMGCREDFSLQRYLINVNKQTEFDNVCLNIYNNTIMVINNKPGI